MSSAAAAALACALIAGLLGWFAPHLVRRLPEPAQGPEPEVAASTDQIEVEPGIEIEPTGAPEGAQDGVQDGVQDGDGPGGDAGGPAKELYLDLANRPGFGLRTALVSALFAGGFGAARGWDPALLYLIPLTPLAVVLAVIDWRTKLLPIRLTVPVYPFLIVVISGLAIASSNLDAWLLAMLGGLAVRMFYWCFWRFTRGMGFGDVRLSGLIGMSLGWLGWQELLTGIYAGFLLGAIGGVLLALLKIFSRKSYPFGPFMLLGAAVGILTPGLVAGYLGN